MRPVGDWIRHNAQWCGERVALDMGDEAYTYAALDAEIDRRAHMIRDGLGLGAGDVLAYLGFNSCDLVMLLFACARSGTILLPLNNRLAPPEHAWILQHCNAHTVIVEEAFDEVAATVAAEVPGLRLASLAACNDLLPGETSRRDIECVSDDAVLLVYTSGTTGDPKGVVHTHGSLFANAINAIHAQEMTAADHVFTVLPLFHAGGMNIQTTPALFLGARVTLLQRFDPGAALAVIKALRPSLYLAVPAVIQAMLDHPDWQSTDLSCLRMVGTGSSTVPDPLLRAWFERGVPATQIYGMTESAPTTICLSVADAERKRGSAGKPAILCDARIVDNDGNVVSDGSPGEIQIRGPNLFREYLHAPALTAQAYDGDWFLTGDIGHVDEEGFFYVDDRKKDMIISGGENIFPAELENVLADMPELSEYAVVGRADDRWGEAAVACVVLAEGASLSEGDLIARFEGKLARFKHPREVRYFDALPRNAMGKVLKFELRTWVI